MDKIVSTSDGGDHALTIVLPEATDEIKELLRTLPKQTSVDGWPLCLYDGFWCGSGLVGLTISCQRYFRAHNTDIILASLPKSGTTWLKALTFSIINRYKYNYNNNHQISPLLTANPHELVPIIEQQVYSEHGNNPDDLETHISNHPGPRIFNTHLPYHSLPNSIPESKCRIIYICRNPLDHFISLRHYLLENDLAKGLSVDEGFELFCRGVYPPGPAWDHVLGYWNAHLSDPQNVLFLKYEDLKQDILFNVKKIADFVGLPFSVEEEEQGAVEEIANLCSFDNLKNLEANKSGNLKAANFKNSSYFRKGQVGDWTNYLTPVMAKRFENILQEKLQGSGLKYTFSGFEQEK